MVRYEQGALTGESMEELQRRHRLEKQDLDSRILQKKGSATKKSRKGVDNECLALERQLLEKQNLEFLEFEDKVSPGLLDEDQLGKSSAFELHGAAN